MSVTAFMIYRQLGRMSRLLGNPLRKSSASGVHRIGIAVIGTETPQTFPVVAPLDLSLALQIFAS